MKALPPLPKDTVRRVVRVARFDGWSVLGVAGVLALAAATMGDYVGAIVGLIVAGAGAGELHGASLLSHGEVRGLKWLIGSQLFLMAAIVSYCALRLLHPDLAPLRALIDAEMKAQLDLLGMSVEAFLLQFYRLVYLAVALATLLYQGGMAFYYARRQTAIRRALAAA